MRSINKVIIIGNLTRDPEMRQTPNGQNVTTFGIATNREWMTREGEKKNSAEFHECVAWARLAEICADYLKKGNLIYIEGYLKTRSWETPEGVKKFKTEIVVQDMIMLEKRKSNEGEEYVPDNNKADLPETEASAEASNSSEQSEIESPIEPKENQPEKEEKSTKASKAKAKKEKPKEEAPKEEPAESKESEESPIDKDLGL
jgi:single-strand DNA-binding protein